MSTCTDLINAINAVVLPPNFTDLAPSCAVLTLSNTTEQAVQLSGGGSAILSAPSASISGRLFKVKVVGKVSTYSGTGGPNFTGRLYLGSSISGTLLANTSSSGADSSASATSFYMEATGIWDATSQRVVGQVSGEGTNPTPGTHYNIATEFDTSASAYSNVQFVVSGVVNSATSGSPTLTISQFSFEYA